MMDDAKNTYKVPTPQDSLESQIIDPSFPKNEREWWASEEITRLRAEVEALKAENAALASWQCLFTDGTTGLYHDGCGNAQCARDHLVVHLTAEVEALRADALKQVDCRQCKHATNRGCHSTALCERGELFEATPPWQFYDAARAAQGGET